MRNHDKRLVRTVAERLYDVTDKSATDIVKTVQRLVEYQQFRVLDESSRKET